MRGVARTVIGAIGDRTHPTPTSKHCRAIPARGRKRHAHPEALQARQREAHPANSTIRVREHVIGGRQFHVMAGPCSVESEKQLLATAEAVKAAGATFLRGGAFKPRTSPYEFQGLGEKV